MKDLLSPSRRWKLGRQQGWTKSSQIIPKCKERERAGPGALGLPACPSLEDWCPQAAPHAD